MLERMAETWEDLANWREEQLEGQKRLAQLDRHGGNGNGERTGEFHLCGGFKSSLLICRFSFQ
jgi:hypothetical protein